MEFYCCFRTVLGEMTISCYSLFACTDCTIFCHVSEKRTVLASMIQLINISNALMRAWIRWRLTRTWCTYWIMVSHASRYWCVLTIPIPKQYVVLGGILSVSMPNWPLYWVYQHSNWMVPVGFSTGTANLALDSGYVLN